MYPCCDICIWYDSDRRKCSAFEEYKHPNGCCNEFEEIESVFFDEEDSAEYLDFYVD